MRVNRVKSLTKQHLGCDDRMNKKDDELEVLENATVIYTDGTEEKFEVIHVTEKGIMIGRVFTNANGKEFTVCGFIPHHSVKEIKNGTRGRYKKSKT